MPTGRAREGGRRRRTRSGAPGTRNAPRDRMAPRGSRRRTGRVQVAFEALAELCRAPCRATDPEQRDIDGPTGRGSPARPRARRATVAWRRHRPIRGPSGHAPARPARRRCVDTARVPALSTNSRRTTGPRSPRLVSRLPRARPLSPRQIPHPPPRPWHRHEARRAGPRPPDDRPSGGSAPRVRRSTARDGRHRGRTGSSASRGWALGGCPVDDPDLDDTFGSSPLQQPRDLRPGHPELLGDRPLCLAQLVIQPAHPNEFLQFAHRSACTFVLDRCASTIRPW